jgi:hypothetical protein
VFGAVSEDPHPTLSGPFVTAIGGFVLHRLSVRLLGFAVAASIGIATPASALTASSTDDPGATTGEVAAQQALAQARALFRPHSGSLLQRQSAATGDRDATLVLRDLALHRADLATSAQRTLARSILARPTTTYDPTGGEEPKYAAGSPVGSDCGTRICVHWVEDGSTDAVHDDGDVNTTPAWVATTLTTMQHVYGVEVGRMGYRAPLSDASSDETGDGRLDVYLADLGADALYGYCTSDDTAPTFTVSAYCVLDNDYAHRQFPVHTPKQNLQVTAAHEFFHAVQFAYDWAQDEWLMEGTAAWMEDQVYDSINDNRQYLAVSPLREPWHSLDAGYDDPYYGYFPPYGSWIFWKFLSENAGRGSADDPGIVKSVWQHAVSSYSTLALQHTLSARHTSFGTLFAKFGTWTRNPGRYFSEGSHYRAAPLSHSFTLTRAHRSTGRRSTHLDHMSRRFFRITPGASLTGRWRLRVTVNLANTSRGSLAQAVVHSRTGHLTTVPIRLGKDGNGSKVIGFRRSSVAAVELDLANDSTRFYSCATPGDAGTGLSCGGVPRDDGQPAVFTATAIR